jgi:hypothetical protein
MEGARYLSLRAILCGAMILFSALLVPLNPNQYFPEAHAQGLDKAPEKKAKEAKVDSETLKMRNKGLAKKEAASAASAEDIRVILELDGKPSASERQELAKLGIKIEGERKSLVQAIVPSTQLDAVAQLDFIEYISQPVYVVPAATSEGASVIAADELNAAGFTGQGIKVGVIDVGFDLGNPEIAPNVVEALSFRADGDIETSDPSHGTAVAEIIVDVAPDVQLFLYNVDTSLSLLNALDHIADQQEVDIVSMSLGIYNVGPYDGTSETSQAVDAIRDAGILFVNSAGNDGQRHWQGNFVDPDANGLRNFSGGDETININVQAGQFVQVFLSWNDWPVSTQDYDLYVLNSGLSLVTWSENPQMFGFAPTEYAEFVAPSTGTYHIRISNFSATQDVEFDLFTTVNLGEYNSPAGSIGIPGDAAGALTVGAVFWENGLLEPFSSRGPTDDGRTKPDISGPDGVTTSTLNPFFGTSAATPYVAGAAALVKDVYPGADADAMQSLLEENTIDNHVKNNDDGTGKVHTSFLLAGIPAANAGPDQLVNETSMVILDGSLSTDLDGVIAAYLWEQVNGTIAVTLTDANSSIASFAAPAVIADTELMFNLTVTDDLGASAIDTITITVQNVNQAPVATAGLDQTVSEDDTVMLNGTASTDPDGDSISYSWTQTDGTSVELDDTTLATPSFTAPEVGAGGETLTFQLTVTDSEGLTGTDTVDIIVNNVNVPPVAQAGPDQTVNEGSPVTLNGTASTDVDGDLLIFSWAQISGPPVTLSGPDTATPSFTAPEVDSAGAILTFELTVSDGIASSTDTVNVSVDNVDTNQAPMPDAGPDQVVNEGDLVTLNGTLSSDPDGDTMTYSWIQTGGPAVSLDDATSATPSFTAPLVDSSGAIITFELNVDDGNGANATDTVEIVVSNVLVSPVADAGADQVLSEGALVNLDGIGSSDPDGDTLSYSWVQVEGPAVILSEITSETPSFTAPEVDSSGATLTFELTVTDNDGLTSTDTVDVDVQNINQAPVANAGSDQTVDEGVLVTLNGTLSMDPDNDSLIYSWIQTGGPSVTLSEADGATASFTAPVVDALGATLTFELTVDDGNGGTAADTVDIIVQNINQSPAADAGFDREVDEGSVVILNGTASSDPDGDILTFSWIQTAGPAVELSESSTPTPSFTAPDVGTDGMVLIFELTVSDAITESTDSVIISVENVNQNPVADAGADQTANEGDAVSLDATGSADPDGDPISFLWIQTAGPAVTLSGADTATPSFTAPEVDSTGAILTFELTVSDDGDGIATDSVEVVVSNTLVSPVAEAGSDQVVDEGVVVALDGSGSTDADGNIESYSWTQINGTSVGLLDADTASPSFTAPAVDSSGATLTFELTVTDNDSLTSTDAVIITVQNVNQAPVANAGTDQVVNEGIVVALDGSGSTDADGDVLAFSWVQTDGPAVSLDNPSSVAPSFTAPEVDSAGGTLTFELTVSDSDASSSDSIDVVVNNVEVNQAPVADAGSDQTVDEVTLVTLNATASSDPDGDTLTYSWVQTVGPPVILNDSSSPTPSFTAPEVDLAGVVLTFELTVDDGNGATAADTVDIIVQDVNRAPTADAGTDVIVEEGDVITLSGTGSSDPDSDPLTYSWVQTGGSSVELINANTATPSFTAPEVGVAGDTLIFELTVSDNGGLTDTDAVSVVVVNVNQTPTADAGSDQTVDEGTVVTLDGSGSSDPDGDALSFSWLQIAGPEVSLDDASSPTPSFTAPDVDSSGAILTFELTVDDANGGIATDSVDVLVSNVELNQEPIANAGPDRTVDEGTLVNLNATGSNDTDDDTLTYSWMQTSGPAVTLLEADTAAPSFTAPLVDSLGATLTFELTVDDGNGGTDTDSVNVIVQNVNQPPVASAGSDQVVDEGTIVVLNGSASSDPDGDTLTFLWTQTAGPTVALSGVDTAAPSFTAPEVDPTGGVLTLEVTVDDGNGGIATDSVDVIVQNVNQAPIAQAGSDQLVDEGATVVLSATGSSDPDGDTLSYSWVQTAGPAMILSDPTSASPSFLAPQVGPIGVTLTFELTVSDGVANTADIVDVVVQNINQSPAADAGSDQTVDELTLVSLNGTGSSDPDGDPITYSWTQIAGQIVILSGADSPAPSFTAPDVDSAGETLTFQLTVDDGNAGNSTDTVDIIVNDVSVNQPPVADAGSDQVVNEGDAVTLNGTASIDPDGDTLTYSWVQTAGPPVRLAGSTSPTPTFTAPEVDSAGVVLTFELTVDDGSANATDTVDIVVNNVESNQAPVTDAGADQTVDEGTIVALNGTGSSDPDGDAVTYSWLQINGTLVQLDDPISPTPSFAAPSVDSSGATLTFELTVTDNDDLTSTDTVNVIVQNVNQPPVADAGPDQTVDEGTVVTLNGAGSTDPDGTIASYSWQQESGPAVSLNNASAASATFLAPQVDADTVLTFRLNVTDSDDSSATDTVIISVNNEVVNSPGGGGGRGGGRGGSGSQTPGESSPSPTTFFALNPLAKIIVDSTVLLDLRGVSIQEASEGQPVQLSSTLINQQQIPQEYVYIVQITDNNGITVAIMTQNGTAGASHMVHAGTSWTPPAAGIYNIDIFIWDNLTRTPVPLSIVGQRTIAVK